MNIPCNTRVIVTVELGVVTESRLVSEDLERLKKSVQRELANARAESNLQCGASDEDSVDWVEVKTVAIC